MYLIKLSVKQVRIKYHFLSLVWFDLRLNPSLPGYLRVIVWGTESYIFWKGIFIRIKLLNEKEKKPFWNLLESIKEIGKNTPQSKLPNLIDQQFPFSAVASSFHKLYGSSQKRNFLFEISISAQIFSKLALARQEFQFTMSWYCLWCLCSVSLYCVPLACSSSRQNRHLGSILSSIAVFFYTCILNHNHNNSGCYIYIRYPNLTVIVRRWKWIQRPEFKSWRKLRFFSY